MEEAKWGMGTSYSISAKVVNVQGTTGREGACKCGIKGESRRRLVWLEGAVKL